MFHRVMRVRYLGRVAIAAGYIMSLGQASLLSQNHSQPPIRTQSGLEQRLTAQKVQDSLHSRLIKTIAEDEERLLPSAKPGEHVSDKIGFLVYDDLEKLAERFDRTIDFDGLNVYQVNGNIIVDNKKSLDKRLIFYPDDTALEAEGFPHYFATFTRLKVTTINGKKTVQEDSKSFDKNFSYVKDMGEYDFSKVYSAVRALQLERSGLRKIKPVNSTFGDKEWYRNHPVDGIKFEYIEQQLGYIRKGLLERYGLLMDGSDIMFGNAYLDYKLISASNNTIHISGVSWNYSTGEETFRTLLIKNRPEAQLTTTLKIAGQLDKFDTHPVYPTKQ